MYIPVLRQRQAINKLLLLYLRRQCLSTCLTSRTSSRHFSCFPSLYATEQANDSGHPKANNDFSFPTYTPAKHGITMGTRRVSIHDDVKPGNKVKPSIRERLRTWELENSKGNPEKILAETPTDGALMNSTVSALFDGVVYNPFQDLGNAEHDNNPSSAFTQEELVDLGSTRPFLRRGDMVELNITSEREPELAIFIRASSEQHSQSLFYTMSGKWVQRIPQTYVFCIPGFVAPEELDDLLPYLPDDSPPSERNILQRFGNSLPRDVGAPLVQKLVTFWRTTQQTYRRFAQILDFAHGTVAADKVLRCYTLEDLASRLLPQTAEKLSNGQFPTSTLYAVHRALMQDPVGFRPQPGGQHRYGSRYEVSPKTEEYIVSKVTEYVRNFQEDQVLGGKKVSALTMFIAKAQQLIDESRKHRDLTTSGTLGPFKQASKQESVALLPDSGKQTFTDTDIEIIRFIEYWTAMRSFRNDSPANGIGSQILRATKKYPQFELNQTLGWTFLQEIGILAPWSTKAQFTLRLPNIGFQLSEREHDQIQNTSDLSLKDHMEALRKDWGSMPVYCIDDVGAHEIDDGVSLERINDNPDEYWVHIHTADPASYIKPSSEIAIDAEERISSVYLPETMFPMIPRDITLAYFSLANNRPCLTFSARMNEAGEILETKVAPGYVRNVKSTTPAAVDEIVEGRKPLESKDNIYVVGTSSVSEAQEVKNELSSQDKENLRKLHSLALARRERAVKRGAVPLALNSYFQKPAPTISVQLNETVLPPSSSAHYHRSDPMIEVKTASQTGHRTVDTTANLMLLGGEISARWCHERNIPVPYRISPRNPDSPDPAKYLREVIMPEINDTGKISPEKLLTFYNFRGTVRPSTTPGPHLGIGVSKFAKCTSPLRRYGDLLLHWQVEAALLEEAKSGQSLVGSTREDYLPFSKQRVDGIIPLLDGRERLIRLSSLNALRAWAAQFVLRGWKYKESSIPFPKTFECTVVRVGSIIKSKIEFLGLEGQFEFSQGKRIKTGDVFECEFEDVNVYLGEIYLKPLRRVQK